MKPTPTVTLELPPTAQTITLPRSNDFKKVTFHGDNFSEYTINVSTLNWLQKLILRIFF